jgi:HSP20 family protein
VLVPARFIQVKEKGMAREGAGLGRGSKGGAVKVIAFEKLFDEVKRITDTVRGRAYQIFEEHGGLLGREWSDWFQAEEELLHPIHLSLSESPDSFTLHAEVPGFRADELEVSVEARRLTIAGHRESSKERKAGKTVFSERCSDRILRVVDLPADVDPQKVQATLKNGMLAITMARADAARKVRVEQKVA